MSACGVLRWRLEDAAFSMLDLSQHPKDLQAQTLQESPADSRPLPIRPVGIPMPRDSARQGAPSVVNKQPVVVAKKVTCT